MPRVLLITAFAVFTSLAVANPSNPSTFTVFFENDLFGDTDQNYTNGLKLSWLSPDLKAYAEDPRVPEWLMPYMPTLLFFDKDTDLHNPDIQRNVVVSVGQSIFTPQNIARFDLIEDDRPYGGWLYMGLAFRKRDLDVLDTLELQAGVVGSLSFAEQAQVLVHELRGLDLPNGWRHQLENEPVFGFAYERKWRLIPIDGPGRFGFDLIPHVGASLGNAFVFGNAGAEMRLGWNLPDDFGDPIIRPGGVTSPPIILRRGSKLRWYLFGYVDLRAVGHDIFLDGNTFASSHSVDKRSYVGDFAAGASVSYQGFRITATQVIRAREFDNQRKDHHFGSLSLSYSF